MSGTEEKGEGLGFGLYFEELGEEIFVGEFVKVVWVRREIRVWFY